MSSDTIDVDEKPQAGGSTEGELAESAGLSESAETAAGSPPRPVRLSPLVQAPPPLRVPPPPPLPPSEDLPGPDASGGPDRDAVEVAFEDDDEVAIAFDDEDDEVAVDDGDDVGGAGDALPVAIEDEGPHWPTMDDMVLPEMSGAESDDDEPPPLEAPPMPATPNSGLGFDDLDEADGSGGSGGLNEPHAAAVEDGPGDSAESEPEEPADDLDESGEADAIDLDEIEELDDLEIEALESADSAGEPAFSAITPPLPPKAPPPMPPRQARARTIPPAPPPNGSGEASGIRPRLGMVAPPEPEIATPTVLDEALEDLDEGIWASRADALYEQIETSADPDLVGVLSYELGELYERRYGDEAAAIKSYNQAIQTDPSLRANLWAIRRIFYRRGLWPNLIKLIDAEIDYAHSDEERAELYVERGHILEDRLGEVDEARLSYEYALDLLVPGTPSRAALPALMSLERIALAHGDPAALEQIWTRLVETVSSPEHKLAYLLDLIDLHVEQQNSGQASELLSRAVELGVERERVARERLRVAESIGDVEGVLAALETRIDLLGEQLGPAGLPPPPEDGEDGAAEGMPAPGASEMRSERRVALERRVVALRRRQARMMTELIADRPDEAEELAARAWNYLQTALELAPGEPVLLADLVDTAEALDRHDDLAELCQRLQAQETDPTRSLSLGLRRADALLRAGRDEEAGELLDSLSAQYPGYLPITALRERDALTRRDWRGLARTYAEAATAALLGTAFNPAPDGEGQGDPGWAASLYVSAGALYEDEVGDPEEARQCYAKALEIRPGYASAVEGLSALHLDRGHLDEAAELLEDSIADEGVEPVRRRLLLERLAGLYRDAGDHEKMLAVQKRLLALDPDGPRSVRLGWRIERTLQTLGRVAEQADLLVALADRHDDPARRAATLYKAARICDEKLDQPARAADLYREVLAVWPGDRYARAALISLLRRAERWEDLVAERRAESIELSDGPTLAKAMREAAIVLAEKLERPGEAAELYRELLDRLPGDPGALRGLARVLDAGDGQPDPEHAADLIDVLERESVADAPDGARRLATLRLALTHERVGRTEDALDTYRRAAETAAGSALAATAMTEIASATGDDFAHIEALTQLAEGRPDVRARAEILEEVGWLWANAVEEVDRATDAFDSAADADASLPGPLLGKTLLLAKQGDIPGVGRTLARLAEAVAAPDARAGMMLRSAAIAEVETDMDTVHERLFQALNYAPEDPSTLIVASEYAALGAPGEEVTPEQLAGRAELFAMRASLSENLASKHDWLLARGEALEAAGVLRKAAHAAVAVLRHNADDIRAIQLLRRISDRAGDRAGFVRATIALARQIHDRDHRKALLEQAVSILDGELGESAAAAPVYREIFALDRGADGFERLAEICREYDDTRTLFEIVSARLDWLEESGDAAAMVPLYYERAMLRKRLGDAVGASRDLALLLAIDSGHAAALSEQGALFADAGDSAGAAALLTRYLEVEADPQKRAAAELTLSQILAEDMGDVAGAIEQLEKVVELSPDDVEVREKLIALLSRAAAWSRAVEQLGELESRRAADSERAGDVLRMAAILDDKLGDPGAASQALERGRRLDPLSTEITEALLRLIDDQPKQRRTVLAGAVGDMRRAIAENPSRVTLYTRLAALHEWQGDRDAEYFALAAADALGGLPADKESFVTAQAAALAAVPMPSSAISRDDWDSLVSAIAEASEHATADVWRAISEAVAKSRGFEPASLGFSRGDKISARNLAKRFAALTAVCESFGLPTKDVECYVSESKPGFARVLSLSKPVLCLGADVASADSPGNRFLLGRAIAFAREGTGSLTELEDSDAALFLAAAAQIAGISPMPPPLALVADDNADAVAEHSRELQKHLGWRDKRALGSVFERVGSLGEPALWRRQALDTGIRAGLLLAGDLGAVLKAVAPGRGGRGGQPATLALLTWSVGNNHLKVRRSLGMATRT